MVRAVLGLEGCRPATWCLTVPYNELAGRVGCFIRMVLSLVLSLGP